MSQSPEVQRQSDGWSCVWHLLLVRRVWVFCTECTPDSSDSWQFQKMTSDAPSTYTWGDYVAIVRPPYYGAPVQGSQGKSHKTISIAIDWKRKQINGERRKIRMSSNGASKSDAENTTREDLVLTSATRTEVSAPEETPVSGVETEAVDTHSGNENKERNNNPIIISEITAGHLDDTASSGLNHRSTMSDVGQTGSIGSSLSSLSAAAAPAFSQHITSVLGMGRGGAFDYESVMNQVYLANMHTRQSPRTQSLPSESSADASSILEAALAQPNRTSTASQGGASSTVPALQIQQPETALDPIREQSDDSKPPALQRDAVNAALSFLQQHHGQTSVLAQHQVLQPQLNLMAPGRVGALLGGSGGIQRDSPAAVAAPAASTVRPTEKDVLFGRGKPILNHHGNRNMRKIADAHRTNYDRADRDDKTEITRMIVRVVKSEGGRFLKHDADLNGWVEVSSETARRKVAHAMRDGRTRPLGRLEPEDFSQPPSSTGSDRDSV